MKQLIWIYGSKGTGKHQFCKELVNDSLLDIRLVDDIKNYSDLEKYTDQPFVLMKTFSPEHCNPDLCNKIVNSFYNNSGYFKSGKCKVLFIATWYSPEEFYDNAKFAFDKDFNISKEDFCKEFKTVYNFNTKQDKEFLKQTIVRNLSK